MPKTHLRKPDGRKSKTVADDASRRTTGPSCHQMEANMSDPLFVETSQGWMNMALVTHASVHGDYMCFVFAKKESGGGHKFAEGRRS